MPHQCTACGHTFEDGSKEMLSGCPDCGGNKFQFRPAGADGDEPPEVTAPTDDAEKPDSPPGDGTSVAETVGRATTRVREFVSSDPGAPADDPNPDAEWPGEWEGPPPDSPSPDSGGDDIIDADARRTVDSGGEGDDGEDTAQASARTEVVSPSELESGAADTAGTTDTADASGTDATDAETASTHASESGSTEAPPPESGDGEIVGEPTGEEPDLAELREQLNDQFESIKILEPGQYELNLMELYDREEYIIALQENGRYVIQVPEQWLGEDPDDR